MAVEAKQNCFEGSSGHSYQFFLEHSKKHIITLQCLHNILPGQFKRIGADKSSLDVLGVGSGGGEVDVGILTLLQSTFPAVPITADVVDSSIVLTDIFKDVVAKTVNLQTIPFTWHIMKSEEYEMEVKAKGDLKRFDFIHMIHMIYFVDNVADTIKFYHSLLKTNGRLMIILGAGNNGLDILWKTYKEELYASTARQFRSSAEVIACLNSLGLKYEEHTISFAVDISECYNPSSQTGEHLMNHLLKKDNFYQSFTPEVRAGILDLLRNKCSTVKDGKVHFLEAWSHEVHTRECCHMSPAAINQFIRLNQVVEKREGCG